MTPAVVLIAIFAYFIVLFGISYIVGHRADNQGFFVGNRKSPWYVVAFAMIGSMISGVTSFRFRVWLRPAAFPIYKWF